MKSIKIPSLSRSHHSEKFYEALVLMEARTRAAIEAKIEEGKTLKIVYFYDLYTHQTI